MTGQIEAAKVESEKQSKTHNDTLLKKDQENQKLRDKIKAFELRVDSSENRKRAAQSEAVVKSNLGMTEEMQKQAISIAKQAFDKCDTRRAIARYISDEAEK